MDDDSCTVKYIEIVPLDDFRNCSNLLPDVRVKVEADDDKEQKNGSDNTDNGFFSVVQEVKVETDDNTEQKKVSGISDNGFFSPVQEIKIEVDEDTEQYKTDDGSSNIVSSTATPALSQIKSELEATGHRMQNTAVSFVWCKTPEGDVPSVSDERRQQMNVLCSAVNSNIHYGENVDDVKDDKDDVLRSLLSSHLHNVGETFSSTEKRVRVQQTDCDTEHQNPYDQYITLSDKISKTEKTYSCDLCCRRFVRLGSLIVHKQAHVGNRPSSISAVHTKAFSTSRHLNKDRLRKTEKPFTCDICHKTFTRVCSLKAHKRTHVMENLYFPPEEEMVKVQQRDNSTERCNPCNRNKSASEKSYSCDMCRKRFFRLGNYKVHRNNHFSNRPYLSTVDTKTFDTSRQAS